MRVGKTVTSRRSIYFSDESAGGTVPAKPGEGTPEGGKNGDSKSGLTQDDLNAALARNNERWEKRFKEADTRHQETVGLLKATSEQSTELRTLMEKLVPKDDPDPDVDDEAILSMIEKETAVPAEIKNPEVRLLFSKYLKGKFLDKEEQRRLNELVTNQQKKIEELEGKVGGAEKARQEAHQASLANARFARINEIIGQLPAADDKTLLRDHLELRVSRNEQTGELEYDTRNKDIGKIPFEPESILQYLPKNALKSKIPTGGSGAQGGSTTETAPSEADIDRLRAQIKETTERALKDPSNKERYMTEVQRLQTELQKKKLSLGNQKAA